MVSETLAIRRAREGDLRQLITLFEMDEAGGHGDTSNDEAYDDYLRAFHVIDRSLNEHIYVGELDGEVVASFQLAFLRTLRARGGLTGMLEAIHTRADMRRRGIGTQMLNFAISEAERRGCRLLQITHRSDRAEMRAFYEKAGFSGAYTGFRKQLK